MECWGIPVTQSVVRQRWGGNNNKSTSPSQQILQTWLTLTAVVFPDELVSYSPTHLSFIHVYRADKSTRSISVSRFPLFHFIFQTLFATFDMSPSQHFRSVNQLLEFTCPSWNQLYEIQLTGLEVGTLHLITFDLIRVELGVISNKCSHGNGSIAEIKYNEKWYSYNAMLATS